MQKDKEFLVYQENGKTYITKGNRITDSIGLKMLKVSSVAIISKENIKHIKQLIMIFSKMIKNGETVDLIGCGIGFYNIPIESIVEI